MIYLRNRTQFSWVLFVGQERNVLLKHGDAWCIMSASVKCFLDKKISSKVDNEGWGEYDIFLDTGNGFCIMCSL